MKKNSFNLAGRLDFWLEAGKYNKKKYMQKITIGNIYDMYYNEVLDVDEIKEGPNRKILGKGYYPILIDEQETRNGFYFLKIRFNINEKVIYLNLRAVLRKA